MMNVRSIGLRHIAIQLLVIFQSLTFMQCKAKLETQKEKPLSAKVFDVHVVNWYGQYPSQLPLYRAHIRLLNTTSHSYLFCCSEDDYFLLIDKDQSVFDTLRYAAPIWIKPNSADTIFVATKIFLARRQIDPKKYLFASIKYHAGAECNFAEISRNYYEDNLKLENTYKVPHIDVAAGKWTKRRQDDREIN